jgi:ketosteroid isomerase-like protein
MATGQTDATSAIEALSEAFVRHLNAGDAGELVRGFYAEDAALLPPNQPLVRGHEQIGDTIRRLLDADFGILSIKTVMLDASGDLAYRIGRYRLGKPAPDCGKFVEVFRRQADGSWRCVAHILNGDSAAGDPKEGSPGSTRRSGPEDQPSPRTRRRLLSQGCG